MMNAIQQATQGNQTALALEEKKQKNFEIIEQLLMQGDLSKLTPEQRVLYYNKVCDSVGLNPFTRPFDYIILNGKLTLYAKKDCTEQLRKIHGVSIEGLEDKMIEGIYVVTAKAKDKHGRLDESKGAVNLEFLKGEAKANAIMKSETKAKRRVTLSICGLGFIDETETETIPGANKVKVDFETGEMDKLPEAEVEIQGQVVPPKTPQVPVMPFDQVTEIMKGVAKLDADSYKRCQKFIKNQWGVNEFEHLPPQAYEPMISAIELNLNKKNKGAV